MYDLTLKQILTSAIMYVIVQTAWLTVKKLFSRSERTVAIWVHYQHRAKQQGHNPKSPVACPEPDCAIFVPKAG